jgi:hypothetical protein
MGLAKNTSFLLKLMARCYIELNSEMPAIWVWYIRVADVPCIFLRPSSTFTTDDVRYSRCRRFPLG